jgi:biopolymer transport protein ExbD
LAIAADKEVPYDFVAKALIAAREAGIVRQGETTKLGYFFGLV